MKKLIIISCVLIIFISVIFAENSNKRIINAASDYVEKEITKDGSKLSDTYGPGSIFDLGCKQNKYLFVSRATYGGNVCLTPGYGYIFELFGNGEFKQELIVKGDDPPQYDLFNAFKKNLLYVHDLYQVGIIYISADCKLKKVFDFEPTDCACHAGCSYETALRVENDELVIYKMTRVVRRDDDGQRIKPDIIKWEKEKLIWNKKDESLIESEYKDIKESEVPEQVKKRFVL